MSQDQQQGQVPLQSMPIIVQYHHQLASFKQQRDQAKVNFDQLNGAIFACEHMINQYEESVKKELIDPALKDTDAKDEDKQISNE